MSRNFYSAILLPALLVGACASLPKGDRIEYAFEKDNHNYNLIAEVPDGSNHELHTRDAQGNLIRYFEYEDGAEFFVACRDSNTQPDIVLASLDEGMDAITQKTGKPGKGMSSDGTYFNRQVRDGFLVGYRKVPAAKVALFEQALLSVAVRR